MSASLLRRCARSGSTSSTGSSSSADDLSAASSSSPSSDDSKHLKELSGRNSAPILCATDNPLGGLRSIRGRSVLAMSLSLGVHLGGYELSRAAVTALFTSDGMGFGHGEEGGLSALPAAVGCVSPFSVALLWFYARTLEGGGPSRALRTHTLICAGSQIAGGGVLGAFDGYMKTDGANASMASWPQPRVKAYSRPLLFSMFVFQNAYVQLLYNQHWAFISSVLTPEEGTRAFAPIAGLGSIGSTLAAWMVSSLVNRVGLAGLLHAAGASYVISALLADMAFHYAAMGGFEPRGRGSSSGGTCAPAKNGPSKSSPPSSSAAASFECTPRGNIFRQARALFRRVPVLGALFLEVIASQCLSSLVNFIYLYKLKSTITDDAMRAGWSGKFYA